MIFSFIIGLVWNNWRYLLAGNIAFIAASLLVKYLKDRPLFNNALFSEAGDYAIPVQLLAFLAMSMIVSGFGVLARFLFEKMKTIYFGR